MQHPFHQQKFVFQLEKHESASGPKKYFKARMKRKEMRGGLLHICVHMVTHLAKRIGNHIAFLLSLSLNDASLTHGLHAELLLRDLHFNFMSISRVPEIIFLSAN